MKIAIVQFHTSDDFKNNIDRMRSILLSIQADFIVLPELWLCPYDNEQIQSAKAYAHQAKSMLQECSNTNHCWIVGGTLPYEEKNMCFVFDRQGNEICHYSNRATPYVLLIPNLEKWEF